MNDSMLEESLSLEWSGEIGQSMHRAREALQEAYDAGEKESIARALVRVAHVHFRLGHYDRAKEMAQEALGQVDQASRARADALILLGNWAGETQPLSEAEAFFRQAVDVSREIGHTVARMRALHGLGQGVYFQRGKFRLALAAEEEAYRIAMDRNLSNWACFPLITIIWLYQVTGQRGHAADAIRELESRSSPHSPFRGYYDFLQAQLALDRGDLDPAREYFEKARSVAEAFGEPGLNIEIRLGMSRRERLAGNIADALHWADDAYTYAQNVGYRHLSGRSLAIRARANWMAGLTPEAGADFDAAIEIFSSLETMFDLAYTLFCRAMFLDQTGSPSAHEAWTEAADLILRNDYIFLVDRERESAFPLIAKYSGEKNELGGFAAIFISHLSKISPLPLRVTVFGTFTVTQGARILPNQGWKQRRAGELFRLLLISPGRSLLRDQVFEALWPGKSPDDIHASFRQATSALRRVLEPELPGKFPSRYLDVDEGRVTLTLPPGSWVDVYAFERNIRERNWDAALNLFSGEPFPDDRYSSWAAEVCERLKQNVLVAMVHVARTSLQGGHPAHALDLCRRMLEIDPWREEAVLIGMRARIELGDRCGAIRLYKDLKQRLQEDFETVPEKAIQTLYKSIL